MGRRHIMAVTFGGGLDAKGTVVTSVCKTPPCPPTPSFMIEEDRH